MLFPDIIAIVPASGRGTRFGAPKSEIMIDGLTFAERIESTLREAGIEQIRIARDLDTPDMLATVRETIADLKPRQARSYLIWPVDHPDVLAQTVKAMCSMSLIMPHAIVCPSYKGKYGHPVLIPASLNLNSGDQRRGLAGIIHSGDYTVVDLPVEDPGILHNINQPSDFEE